MKIIPLEAKHYADVKSIHEEGIASGVATFETQAPNGLIGTSLTYRIADSLLKRMMKFLAGVR